MTREVDPGPGRISVDKYQVYSEHFVGGLIATGSVATISAQYSPVATIGTTAVQVLLATIDPGVDLRLKETYMSLIQRFTEVNNTQGTVIYNWEARRNNQGTQGAWIGISPTLSKGVGSLANSEDVLSGYVPVGSLPDAPLDIRLMASCLKASQMVGEIKNASLAQLSGFIIPGT